MPRYNHRHIAGVVMTTTFCPAIIPEAGLIAAETVGLGLCRTAIHAVMIISRPNSVSMCLLFTLIYHHYDACVCVPITMTHNFSNFFNNQ